MSDLQSLMKGKTYSEIGDKDILDAINDKVEQEEGKTLISTEDINKFNQLAEDNTSDEAGHELLVPYSGSTDDLDLGDNGINYYGADWTGGNVTYIPCPSDPILNREIIQFYIDSSVPGDTLILASGTYTLSASLIVNKAITIKGQGNNSTIIAKTTNGDDSVIKIVSSNVNLLDVQIYSNTSDTDYGLYISALTNQLPINNINIDRVYININGSGAKYGISNSNVDNLKILNTDIKIISLSSGYGVYCHEASTQNTNVFFTNVTLLVDSRAVFNQGFKVSNEYGAYSLNITMYNCKTISLDNATYDHGLSITSSANKAINVTAYDCVFGGTDYDVVVSGAGSILNLYNCTIVHNLTSGVINFLGQNRSSYARFGSNSNYTDFEVDGTLKMVGDATVYNDLIIQVSNLRGGISSPTFAAFQNGVYANRFDNNLENIVYGSIELQHDYKEGSDLEVHLHWSPSTTNTDNVKFNFEYTVAETGVGVFGTTTNLTATQAGSGVVNHHQYLSLGIIPGTGRKIGDVVCFALSRLGNDIQDTFTGDAFIHQLGTHYQCDTLGSRTISGK